MNRKKLAMAAAASIAVIVSIAGPRIARAADEDRVAGEQRRWYDEAQRLCCSWVDH